MPASGLTPGFEAADMGLICAAAGVTSAIQLRTHPTDDFDTHVNHTVAHSQCLAGMADMVNHIWDRADQLKIASQLFMIIYTEIGRSKLNNQRGKDHWQVCSWQLIEQGVGWGNRVFGASGPQHEPLAINKSTGKVDPSGSVLTARDVHAALRSYLGIDTVMAGYPLNAKPIALFDPNVSTGYPTA